MTSYYAEVILSEKKMASGKFWLPASRDENGKPTGPPIEPGPLVFVLLREKPEGFFLINYDAQGQFRGDEWYETFEDAKAGAMAAKFSTSLRPWSAVPDGVDDPVKYVADLLN